MSIQVSTNRGLNVEKEIQDRTDEDWLFGGTSQVCRASIPLGIRAPYLPQGEVQRGTEDTMDCASRWVVNALETKFNYLMQSNLLTDDESQWLIEKGYFTDGGIEFSDAFIAILSGTTRQGNSLKAPVDTVHRVGLIPKRLLPLKKGMTFDDYHNPARITEEYKLLGLDFLARFPIFYERVSTDDMLSLLRNDIVGVGGYAWESPDEKGMYQPTSAQPNHAFMLFDIPQYQAFDNYEEGRNDFIKHLAPDYKFLNYGYRVYIGATQNNAEQASGDMRSVIEHIMTLLQDLLLKLKA